MSWDDRDSFGERQPSRKAGSSACLPWALGCGGVGLIVMLVCCGGVGVFGVNLMSTEAELALRDNAQIREHLGELSSVRVNLLKSVSQEGDDVWVYDLTGAKGNGELTTLQTTDDNGDEVFHSAKLRLSDGKTVDIEMQPPANAPDVAPSP